MEYLKYIYYAFGGFIGFVCGLIIQLIFMKLEDSKTLLLSTWVEQYGFLGRFMIYLVEGVPYMGVMFGVLLIHWMFSRQFAEDETGIERDKED